MYAYVYFRAKAAGDTALAARVAGAYLDHLDDAFAYFEGRSLETLGREIPQVLLLHANRLNADVLDELLARIRDRGYAFVRLEDALADSAYRTADRYVGRGGPSWIERWALAARSEARQGPREHAWVAEAYARLRGTR